MILTPEAFNGSERRRHKRFIVKDDALVFLGKETGAILDISKGGLSVRYTVLEKDPSPLPPHLDIFFARSGFYLPCLPVFLVSETQTRPNSIFSSLRVKRLSMKFGPLSSDQQARLEDFITSNTVGEC